MTTIGCNCTHLVTKAEYSGGKLQGYSCKELVLVPEHFQRNKKTTR